VLPVGRLGRKKLIIIDIGFIEQTTKELKNLMTLRRLRLPSRRLAIVARYESGLIMKQICRKMAVLTERVSTP
jgi:hypothetical protein